MGISSLILLTALLSTVIGQQGWGSPQSGTLVLTRNGVYSKGYNSGRVVVYGVGAPSSLGRYWGNVCRLSSFGLSEANVICHQLAFAGASTWSYTAVDSFGVDNRSALLSSVSCSSNRLLTLFQCSVSTVIPSGCNDNNDVAVTCYTIPIWNNPSNGQIRLSRGNFTNEGLLEVYCNGQWGTVCDNTFSSTAATVVCKELGYSQHYMINTITLIGNSNQSIWLNSLSCSSSSACLSSCQRCPSAGSSVTSCAHVEDVTIICYSSSIYSTNRNTNTTCPSTSSSDGSGGLSGGAIAGIVIGSVIGAGILIGFISHINNGAKRKRDAQAATAQRLAAQAAQAQAAASQIATPPAPPPVQLTNITPGGQETPPQTHQSTPPPYPTQPTVDNEEKKMYHQDDQPANPTAPSFEPPQYPATGYASYPPPTNPGYPPPINSSGYPDPSGYPPPASNPAYPPYPSSTGYPPYPTDDTNDPRGQPPPYYNPAYPPQY